MYIQVCVILLSQVYIHAPLSACGRRPMSLDQYIHVWLLSVSCQDLALNVFTSVFMNVVKVTRWPIHTNLDGTFPTTSPLGPLLYCIYADIEPINLLLLQRQGPSELLRCLKVQGLTAGMSAISFLHMHVWNLWPSDQLTMKLLKQTKQCIHSVWMYVVYYYFSLECKVRKL